MQWQIPFVPHEGKLYQIVVNSTYKSWLVSDVSDALFSITNCAEKRKSWKEPSARSKTQSELRRKKIVKCTSAEKRKSGTASPECEKKLKKTATKKKTSERETVLIIETDTDGRLPKHRMSQAALRTLIYS